MTLTSLVLRSVVYGLPVALACWFFYWLSPTPTEIPHLNTALFWWYQLIPFALLLLTFGFYKLYQTWEAFSASCKQESNFIAIMIFGLFGAFGCLSGLCFLASMISYIVGGFTIFILLIALRLSKIAIANSIWHSNVLLISSRV